MRKKKKKKKKKEIKNYEVGVAFSGVTFILNLVKIYQLVPKLGHTHTKTTR
jgi:hypothetical protein